MRLAPAVLAIAILAQLTSTAQTHNHGSTPTPPDGSAVSVTGCLARGPAANTFVLRNVSWQSANTPAAKPAGSAPATAQQPDAPRAAESLRLAGAAATLKLEAHVGHTITATGTLAKRDPIVTPGIVLPDPQPQGDTTARTGRAGSGRGDDAESRAAANLRTLDLRTMSHVAAECK